MTFISLSFSFKTSNILEKKSQVFERSDCTITVHNDLYYNENLNETQQRYHVKSKKFKLKKFNLI